jgi:hypothetical protein
MIFITINKSSLASFTTNFFALLVVLITSIAPNKINYTDLQSFNNYPDYLWVYVFYFFTSPTIQLVGLFVIGSKSLQLKNYIKRELRSLFFLDFFTN